MYARIQHICIDFLVSLASITFATHKPPLRRLALHSIVGIYIYIFCWTDVICDVLSVVLQLFMHKVACPFVRSCSISLMGLCHILSDSLAHFKHVTPSRFDMGVEHTQTHFHTIILTLSFIANLSHSFNPFESSHLYENVEYQY